MLKHQNKTMDIKSIEDIENIENSIPEEKILLYTEFLTYFWDKCSDSYSTRRVAYEKAFPLTIRMLISNQTSMQNAIDLILWMIIKNENKLPDNLQAIFNEWLLEKKL